MCVFAHSDDLTNICYRTIFLIDIHVCSSKVVDENDSVYAGFLDAFLPVQLFYVSHYL